MISWDRVNELKSEVGEEDFAEVVEIFLEEMDESMVELRAIPPDGELGSAMHFVKGAAMNLGFDELGSICQVYETMADDGQTDQIDCAKVIACYENSKAEFINNATKMAA